MRRFRYSIVTAGSGRGSSESSTPRRAANGCSSRPGCSTRSASRPFSTLRWQAGGGGGRPGGGAWVQAGRVKGQAEADFGRLSMARQAVCETGTGCAGSGREHDVRRRLHTCASSSPSRRPPAAPRQPPLAVQLAQRLARRADESRLILLRRPRPLRLVDLKHRAASPPARRLVPLPQRRRFHGGGRPLREQGRRGLGGGWVRQEGGGAGGESCRVLPPVRRRQQSACGGSTSRSRPGSPPSPCYATITASLSLLSGAAVVSVSVPPRPRAAWQQAR